MPAPGRQLNDHGLAWRVARARPGHLMVDIAPGEVSFPLAERPRLRMVVEPFRVRVHGRPSIGLHDPAEYELEPVVVDDEEFNAVRLLDGRRTLKEWSAALTLRGSRLTESRLQDLLIRMDRGGLLEGPRATARLEQREARFRALPLRPAVHTGAYSANAQELPRLLTAGYLHRDGPGAVPAERPGPAAPLRAAIAPHVDLHRGAPTYSWAYKALAEAQPADLYVILGTCHTPVRGHFAATLKAYDTPLGPVPSDPGFGAQLGRAWGRDLFEGEYSHANEHSIEFQAVYLRSLGLAGEGSAAIVPLLCDSLHSMVPPGKTPREVPVAAEFLDALQHTLAEDGRRITLIAAVDLAHIGPSFGDSWSVDPAHQASVGRADREMLDLMLAPDADGYYAQVMRDRDARRICGFTPIYLLTALMQAEHRSGELLRYTQWVAPDQSSSVTFTSAIFR